MPVVWQIFALHLTDNRTLINGVILENMPYRFNRKSVGITNFIKVLGSYFTQPLAKAEIYVESNGEILTTQTDPRGAFSVVTHSLHRGDIQITQKGQSKALHIIQSYPILFEETDGAIDVISDIDDTIIVSHSVDFFKRVSNLAFKPPHKRKVIDFTKEMLNHFKSQGSRISYVSKSESNLFGSLTSFIKHSEIPNGPLFLTPYLQLKQLFNPQKEKDFKSKHIRFLIENTAPKRYVFFGDDSQRDMAVYTEMVEAFPERIERIYIRQTKRKILPHQHKMMKELKSTSVPIIYFKSSDDIDIPS